MKCKKIILSVIAFAVCLTMAGCGGSEEASIPSGTNSTSSNTTTTTTTTTSTTTTTVATEASSAPSESKPDSEGSDLFEKVQSKLSAYSFEIVEKDGSYIGAEKGCGYKFDDGEVVEMYAFDKSSDAYKAAEQSQTLNMEAFGITYDAVVKNGYAVIKGEGKYYDAFIAIFNELS